MKALRTFYHMARADFLERTRRYSFLIMLGLVVWLGYASATGIMVLSVPPNYVGVINSAWIGALMTVTVTMFLGWFGFYLVKGSVSRDYETGVGQIMATTPLSRPLYTLGKWLSNFAVLGVMILIVMAAGVLMNLLASQAPLDLWALVSPLIFIALPCMAIVAALAVIFETVGWLRGGLGNLVYFFLFVILLVPNIESDPYQPLLDFTGIRLFGDRIAQAASLAYPESEGGFNFSLASNITQPQQFLYDGIAWSADILLPRLFFLLAALLILLLAAAFFDRFNPSRVISPKKQAAKSAAPEPASSGASPVSQARLTPLSGARRFHFEALFIVELKLLLKGQRWWWYAVALGLIVAQMATAPEISRILLAVAWLWPILLLSGLGSRERRYNTREIVFSTPRPVRNQLPALWLAAFTLIALLGSGAFLRFLIAGETASLLAWGAGALFIPSLALAFGVVTGSSKAFEVIYVLWMYILLNHVPPLDFVGVAPGSPWYIYALLAPGLLALAAFVRGRQLKVGNR